MKEESLEKLFPDWRLKSYELSDSIFAKLVLGNMEIHIEYYTDEQTFYSYYVGDVYYTNGVGSYDTIIEDIIELNKELTK